VVIEKRVTLWSLDFPTQIFPAHLDPAFEIPFLHLISQSGFYVHFVIIAARQLLMVAVIIIKCFAFFLILLPSLLFHFPIPSILFFFVPGNNGSGSTAAGYILMCL